MKRIPALFQPPGLAAFALLGACFCGSSLQEAAAQSRNSAEADWLRYSNWERRGTKAPQNRSGAKKHYEAEELDSSPSSSSSPASGTGSPPESESEGGAGSHSASAAGLPLPEHPGSQTVDGVQPSIPGWAFQAAKQATRSPQIIIGGDTLGRAPGWGSASSWGSLYPYGGGFRPSWGARNFMGAGGGFYPGGAFRPFGWQNAQSDLGPQVIETGPSPASGNYYQPSSGDPSASGNYYAGGSPWQVPINAPNNPKDYWGPQGNPFKH